MDFLTTKQWFFLAFVSYCLIVYFGYSILHHAKEARRDRAKHDEILKRIGAALGIDFTKEQ